MTPQAKRAAPGKESARQNTTRINYNAGIDGLLARLERVKQTGPDRWIASSPTRRDSNPSLTIRLLDDGRILLHDFGGDSTENILSAVGLTFSDLFPDQLGEFKPERRPFPAADVLRCVTFEALVVVAAAAGMATGTPLCAMDRERLMVAMGRLQEGARRAGL